MKTLIIILIVLIAAPILMWLIISGFYLYLKPISKPINSEVSESYFFGSWKNKDAIIFSTNGFWFQTGHETLDVDKNSFEVLDNFYAKDKNQVLYKHHIIDVDTQSFRIDEGVPKDNQYVYFINDRGNDLSQHIIEGADPATYQELDYPIFWGKDVSNYYNRYKALDVDRQTFEIITSYWAKDKDNTYRIDDDRLIIENINPDEITVMNDEYIRDEQAVYYITYDRNLSKSIVIQFPFNAASKLEFLSANHIRHNDKIYFQGQNIENADARSFQLLDRNIKHFSVYGKDKDYGYFERTRLEGVDLASFREDGHLVIDKNRKYDNEGSFELINNTNNKPDAEDPK